MQKDLKEVFAKFAGREFPFRDEEFIVPGTPDKKGIHYKITDHEHPTYLEVLKTAEENHVGFRVFIGDSGLSIGWNDAACPNEVSTHLIKGTDGQWHFGNSFDMGPKS